jgi:hypothetical protein
VTCCIEDAALSSTVVCVYAGLCVLSQIVLCVVRWSNLGVLRLTKIQYSISSLSLSLSLYLSLSLSLSLSLYHSLSLSHTLPSSLPPLPFLPLSLSPPSSHYRLRAALKSSSQPHDAAVALNISEVRYHIARLAVSVMVYLLVATGEIETDNA